MDAPERIWTIDAGQALGGGHYGTWRETLHEPDPDRTEYVRADLLTAEREKVERLEAELRRATDPAYLASAIEKVGMVDAEWKDRAEKSLAALAAEREACAMVAEDSAPATQDMLSTEIAEHCDYIAATIRARTGGRDE